MRDILCGRGLIPASITFGSKVWSANYCIAFSWFLDVVMLCGCKLFITFAVDPTALFSWAVYGLASILIVRPFMPISGFYFLSFL